MKISLDWLSDYVKIDRSVEEIAEILSDLGFPTEGIEYPEDDAVIDIEVSSNRGDCLSYIGIARELAAATGKKLKVPKVELQQSGKKVDDFVAVAIDEPQLCNRYTARIICGVKVGPTPGWMKKRLEAVGIRSVNNIVDATNYAMLETAQPPHAFDYEKIGGGRIVVRRGVLGEQLVSIDGTRCDVGSEMLIIADEKRPVAIAGVMGGLDTEVSDSTTTILLEDAHFDPVSVRTTGRKLGISSEAAFRFERHVDTEMVDWASHRTAELIVQVAGGVIAKGVVDAYPVKAETKTVGMRVSRLNKLLGIEVDKDRVLKILEGLSFEPKCEKADLVVCTVPTWRHDIHREVDLIEEVARSHGYDRIPIGQKISIEVSPVDKREKLSLQLRTFLNGCGFYETINVTFVDSLVAELFAGADESEHLSVKDESRKSANILRQNLLGSLLGVLKSNYNAGNIPCRIYELAETFKAGCNHSPGDLPIEGMKVGLVLDGDLRSLRGVVEGLIKVVNKDVRVVLIPAELNWAQAGAEIIADGQTIGICGIISADVAEKFDLSEMEVCAAELDFDILQSFSETSRTVKPIPRFPAITRDLSLIVDEEIGWSGVVDVINRKAPGELEDVSFAGIYRGKPIPNGKKSLTVSLRFRDEDGTLRHEVVDGFENEIFAELQAALGAQLRTV